MPLDSRVSLLIGAETAIVDESSYALPLTAVGNAARTTAQFKYGAASLTFDGAGDWIQTPAVTTFDFGSADFTVEGWFRFQIKTTTQALMGQWGDNSWFFYHESGQLLFRTVTTTAAMIDLAYSWTPTLGQWYHLAVDRSGSTLRLYIDGVVVATNASYTYTIHNSLSPLSIGAIGVGSSFSGYDYNGQMDEVRITKGLARYAGAFTPSGPFPRSFTRVQGTGRVTTSGASVSLTFSTPPAIGNGVVVLVANYGATVFPSGGCADNRGHTYSLALTTSNSTQFAAIYYLPIVTTSAAPFTITVTPTGGGYYEAAAVEVSGVGTGLTIDQVVGQANTAVTVTTGASPALVASEVFVAAVHAIGANQASITAEVLSPSWVQEFENLNYSATVAAEGDTRVQTSATGTTVSGTWTDSNGGNYAAVLAAFRAAPGAGPTGLARVQTTPKGVAGAAATVTVTFAATPTLGNGIIVPVLHWNGGASAACSDNQGNTYALATSVVNATARLQIFYCAKTTATGSPFTVTITGGNYPVTCAIEVSGVGTGLGVDQAITNIGSSTTTPSTGTTAALTAAQVFVVAGFAADGGIFPSTVGVATPGWMQELEEVSFTYAIGEANSRLVGSATGTTQSCGWTIGTSRGWAGALAAFKADAGGTVSTTPAQVSQLPVEALILSDVPIAARLSQLPLEALIEPPPIAARVSQLPVEVLILPDIAVAGHVSQLPIEVLISAIEVVPVAARLSQLPIEILIPPSVPAQVTQVAIELVDAQPGTLTLTQLGTELLSAPDPNTLQVTQVAAEYLFANVNTLQVTQVVCELIIIPGPVTEACAIDFPIDPA